jgi:hypothetical protein
MTTHIHSGTPLMSHPDTRAIYEYWNSKRGARSMPRRADIDPAEIPSRLLPFLSLIEPVADERRYVYRLMGTAEVQVRGFDPTGKSVYEGFLAPVVDDAISRYDIVVATRAPHLDPVPFKLDGAQYQTQEAIFLPLSDDGVSVNRILVLATSRHVLDPDTPIRLDL